MAPAVPEACAHILQAIREIETYVAGLSDDQIKADRMRLRAIERCVEIISEAVRHMPDEARANHPQIPWRSIAGIGNFLRHGYFDLNDDIILRAVRMELAALEAAVKAISPIKLDSP